MKVIGLTGGIGSGKSTVAGLLAGLGAAVIDLDKVGHEVIRPGSEVYREVVREFGGGILNAAGGIDRARLGDIVFRSAEALASLNRIVHPAIDRVVEKRVADYRRRGAKAVVLEAAAILEAGRAAQTDEIWVTVAPEATVLKRLSERSGYSEEESKARLRSQLSTEERIRHADVVINTDCSLEELEARVRQEWDKLMARGSQVNFL
jgi:dephospho-CoA kinase